MVVFRSRRWWVDPLVCSVELVVQTGKACSIVVVVILSVLKWRTLIRRINKICKSANLLDFCELSLLYESPIGVSNPLFADNNLWTSFPGYNQHAGNLTSEPVHPYAKSLEHASIVQNLVSPMGVLRHGSGPRISNRECLSLDEFLSFVRQKAPAFVWSLRKSRKWRNNR